jgi:hypothetical protein
MAKSEIGETLHILLASMGFRLAASENHDGLRIGRGSACHRRVSTPTSPQSQAKGGHEESEESSNES